MTSSVNDSLQERLGEELGLLPGRISRTFFLLATLDAQASLVKSDLQNNRIRLLENLSNNSSSSDLTISSSQQLSALRQLHQVQHQLLADKLFVDQKASEWLSRAKNVVNRFNQESRRGFKQSSGFHPPNFDLAISRRSLDLSQPEASIDDRHGTRFRKSLFDECAEYSSNSFGPYGLRPSDSSNSAVGSNFKRRRVLGYDDFVLPPGRPPHRRLDGSISSHTGRVSTGEVGRPPKSKLNRYDPSQLLPGSTFTIKLGSTLQKGRPCQSPIAINNKVEESLGKGAETLSVTEPPMYETEEYFCPICNKSDYHDPAMVACDACDRWFHCVCVGFHDLADAESTKSFYCPNCRELDYGETGRTGKATAPSSTTPEPDDDDF